MVITRAPERAGELARRFRALGAVPVFFPAIRLRPVRVRSIRPRGYSHAAFTSRTAVDLFFRNLAGGIREWEGVVFCAVGEQTAAALRDHGVRPRIVAREFTSRALARDLCRRGVRGAHVFHPGADRMNPDFARLLRGCGARVTNLVLYRIGKVPARGAREVRDADWITFASAQTVRNFMEAMNGRPGRARIACIGPVTARAARQLGLRVSAVPRQYTLDALVREIVRKA